MNSVKLVTNLVDNFKKSCSLNKNTEENEICGICSEDINTHKDLDTLRCKHVYHHACILEWFISIEKKKGMGTVLHRQCPYCCVQSDYLPLRDNEIPVKYVHKQYTKAVKAHASIKCKGSLKSGKKCRYKAKYNGYCGIHAGQIEN